MFPYGNNTCSPATAALKLSCGMTRLDLALKDYRRGQKRKHRTPYRGIPDHPDADAASFTSVALGIDSGPTAGSPDTISRESKSIIRTVWGLEAPYPCLLCGLVLPGESEENVLVPRFFLLFSLLDVP
jgi:hypothetical protein